MPRPRRPPPSSRENDEREFERIAQHLGRSFEQPITVDVIAAVAREMRGLTLREATQILYNTLQDHKNDPNFSEDTRKLLSHLIAGPRRYRGNYEFDVKAEAATIRWFSPYVEVRAVTDPADHEMPCETIRAYVLGLLWSVIGQFCNTYFYTRSSVVLNAAVCQTFVAPMGYLCGKYLPDWGFKVKGHRIGLNPGPWCYKEQMLATIMLHLSIITVYAFRTITLQEDSMYFDDGNVRASSPWYKLLLIFSSQLMGLGFAGLLRRFVVFPVQALWPSAFPILALNRALIVPGMRSTGHKRSRSDVGTQDVELEDLGRSGVMDLSAASSDSTARRQVRRAATEKPHAGRKERVVRRTHSENAEISEKESFLHKPSEQTISEESNIRQSNQDSGEVFNVTSNGYRKKKIPDRLKFFLIAFFGMFSYHWFPAFIIRALSRFSWIRWISLNSIPLAVVAGSQAGLGFNPWSTFDWDVIHTGSPLNLPFFSYMQQYVGMFIGGLVILIVYFTNTRWTAYLPINDQGIYANNGNNYDTTNILADNQTFLVEKYQQYSPVFYTAGELISYAANFILYPLILCYVLLDQRKLVGGTYSRMWRQLKMAASNFWSESGMAVKAAKKKDLMGLWRHTKTAFHDPLQPSIYEGFNDPFTQSMKKYREVPDWWFHVLVLVSFVFALVVITSFHFVNTPVWVLFFCLAVNLVFLVPVNIIYAITGTGVGLGILVQFIVGWALPGKAYALLFANLFGDNIDIQASNYAIDQKMGHYTHLPPRAVFRAQISATVLTCLMAFCIAAFINSDSLDICGDLTSGESAFCNNGLSAVFSETIEWGVIGPKRVILEQYPALAWMIPLGFAIALVWWAVRTFGPRVREAAEARLHPMVFTAFNWTVFKPFSSLYSFQPAFLFLGMARWGNKNLSEYTVGLYFSFFFMYYLRKYRTRWWKKYNYLLASALDAGMALTAILVFLIQWKGNATLDWWGNNVVDEQVDGSLGYGNTSLKAVPPSGHFGPDKWE